jgi:hypothetical protein
LTSLISEPDAAHPLRPEGFDLEQSNGIRWRIRDKHGDIEPEPFQHLEPTAGGTQYIFDDADERFLEPGLGIDDGRFS